MSKDSEELTTFLTRFGTFKYLVMPFGLCNGPASWHHLINDTLFDFSYCLVQAYLDDIFIYSKTLQDHRSHVCQVLHAYKKPDCKPILINASFMFKKQNFSVLLSLLKVFK